MKFIRLVLIAFAAGITTAIIMWFSRMFILPTELSSTSISNVGAIAFAGYLWGKIIEANTDDDETEKLEYAEKVIRTLLLRDDVVNQAQAAVNVVRECEEYLSENKLNNIWSGSILHTKMREVVGKAIEEREV